MVRAGSGPGSKVDATAETFISGGLHGFSGSLFPASDLWALSMALPWQPNLRYVGVHHCPFWYLDRSVFDAYRPPTILRSES